MDEDAELAALRRRAYGPSADITDDPTALARLAALENRDPSGAGATAKIAGLEHPSDDPAARSGRAVGVGTSGGPASGRPASGRRASARPAPGRPAWHTSMVVAVAALALLIGGAAAARTGEGPRVEASVAPVPTVSDAAAAFRFAADPASDILVRIPLDGVAGQSLDLPLPEAGPRFPTDRDLRWSRTLGDYYGWQLWIARDADGRACMLVEATDTLSRCVSIDEQGEGALFLSVPFAAVAEAERPAGMTEEQSIGFWWIPVDTVLVLTGRTADTAEP